MTEADLSILAVMATAAYRHYRRDANEVGLPSTSGWRPLSALRDGETGFEFTVFKHDASNRIVIAFTGQVHHHGG